MARKELYYSVSGTKGRDEGKMYHIQEMSASQAEWWAIQVGMAMSRNGVEVPDDLSNMGMAAMAMHGLALVAKIPAVEAKPLLDELMACVQAVPNPNDKKIQRPLVESDTEEVATRLKLRMEVFKLHVDFLLPASA
ncbi:hypothetical protein ACMV5I_26520 [Serratia sp. T13T92]|uniref:hypothetical protein n=1 Tax=Serratia sp. T13T92 TaxID=3397496 RepID=UPI0039E1126C